MDTVYLLPAMAAAAYALIFQPSPAGRKAEQQSSVQRRASSSSRHHKEKPGHDRVLYVMTR
jgi:hypothetical protein